MKKFMVVTCLENECHAKFFDTLREAEVYRMNAECGVGAYAEVYKYDTKKLEYKMMFC